MRVTLALAVAMIIVFIYSAFFSANVDEFYNYYGFSGTNLLARPYVLFTSIFLHANLEHLLSNLLVLLFFGIAVEKELKASRMLAVFFLGAIAGDILSLFVYPFDSLAIGASAGIFALIGVGMLVKPLDLSFYPLTMPIPLLFLGIGYAVYNVYGFFFMSNSEISYIAHFGGLFVGLIVGFAETGFKKGLRTLALGIAALAAIAALLLFFVK
jgi:membrane associated rhomboid family serine protease